ncbi:MAG: hypothetical protein ACI9UN_001584 [Granulosicoccus sp.]
MQNLFYLTDGWRRAVLMFIALLPLLLAWIFIPFKRVAIWSVMAALVAAAILTAHFSEPLQVALDKRFGNSVWNRAENFRQRGLALHIAQESIRTLAKVGKFPNRDSVRAVTEQLPVINTPHTNINTDAMSANSDEQRIVHVIVLESFFDPITLGPTWVPEDPFPEDFREL